MELLSALGRDVVETARTQDLYFVIVVAAVLVFGVITFAFSFAFVRKISLEKSSLLGYLKFVYASFLRPHSSSLESGQQSALEGFYGTQAAVYDATRKRLLLGREDMLGLLAAQLRDRSRNSDLKLRKPVWIDVGGGTGYNIEYMHSILNIGDFFGHVYLVDFSPSLCEVARQRVQRMGWSNVSIVCQDARSFQPQEADAELITMSYSLSMIPDYYSVVDSLTKLLSPDGLIGACDFYVQSIVDLSSRNYSGGTLNRHVNWLGRLFWRAWFDADRVNLDGGRRDYLEYRFGTVLSASDRNYLLGGIPYYIFVGCRSEVDDPIVDKLDATFTESPYLSPKDYQLRLSSEAEDITPLRSKAYESAIVNLSSKLPLPSAFYQNHHWRICYNDLLQKHQQFNDEYIYAFNWEDPQVDLRLLNIKKDDVILTITSAGDNVLDYLLESPRRVHSVDLNPNQNHLLELKIASFTALSYADTWKLFGEGRHENFRNLLIHDLSPHMSSQAFQYWLDHISVFTRGNSLYESGGSRHAIKLVRWLFKLFGLSATVRTMCTVETLNEQRELWPQIRRVLMSWMLHRTIVASEWWAWKAGGVPKAQRQMILNDFAKTTGRPNATKKGGEAIWEYMVNSLDPVVESTLLSKENYFYYLCLQGRFSRACHPRYLGVKAHAKLSKPGAFDGLRIHTDEIMEVIARITPATLTIAVLMDSMDWFDPESSAAQEQISALNRALKVGGRVLFRSAALRPWYTVVFEENRFSSNCVGKRTAGKCIDRVNMYASTWICTKIADLPRSPVLKQQSSRAGTLEKLEI